MIPSLVPGELLPPANALETTSFNSALVVGPALAGTLSAVVGPEAPLLVEAGARPRRARADRAHPWARLAARAAPDERTLWSIAADGLRQIVVGAAAARRDGRGGVRHVRPRAAHGRVPAVRGRAPRRRAERRGIHVGGVRGRLDARRAQPRADPAALPARADRAHRVRDLRRAHAELAARRRRCRCSSCLVALAALVDGPALAAQFARAPAARAAVALRAGVHDGRRAQGRVLRRSARRWPAWSPRASAPRRRW